ncbi:MAG TPA: rhomboid family intramembrane serine protease [Acidobacteriota bacterium]|jgi:membrane associated rhomboid family serine protease
MVLPLRDINPRHRFPLVTVALIVLNFLGFLYELALGPQLERFIFAAAFVPSRYWVPGGLGDDLQSMVLSMFLHGGWVHLLGNMLYLWIFGDNIEDRLGHLRFLIFYLLAGFCATYVHALFNPDSTIPSIGASGAIAGVLGAYALAFPRARVVTLVPLGFYMQLTELPALVVLGLWFVLQLFSGAAEIGVRSAQTGGVAWWAHIGGFVAGLVLIVLMGGLRGARRTTSA